MKFLVNPNPPPPTDPIIAAARAARHSPVYPSLAAGPSPEPLGGHMTKYFFDTEFIESGRAHPIEIISIGIVSEDGRELYLERADVPWELADQWVLDNVKPHLHLEQPKSIEAMRLAILNFIADGYERPEFWAFFADYDWVVLCGLFGKMIDLPAGWPMYCRDLKQEADRIGAPRNKQPEQSGTEHHALADARWNLELYRWLCSFGAAS